MSLEIVVQSDLRSSQVAIQQESIGAIEVMVVTDFSEAESGSELFGGLPCDTRLECHGIVTGIVKQTEVAAEVHEQRELLTDGATHVTDIGLKGQRVDVACGKTIVSTKSDLPFVVDHITHFRSDGEMSVVLLDASSKAATNPYLCVCSEDACEGKCQN